MTLDPQHHGLDPQHEYIKRRDAGQSTPTPPEESETDG